MGMNFFGGGSSGSLRADGNGEMTAHFLVRVLMEASGASDETDDAAQGISLQQFFGTLGVLVGVFLLVYACVYRSNHGFSSEEREMPKLELGSHPKLTNMG